MKSLSSKASIKGSLKTRCPKCFRLLCMRIPVHLEKDETFIVHVKHKGMELWAYDVILVCPACRSTARINGQDGLIGKIKNEHT